MKEKPQSIEVEVLPPDGSITRSASNRSVLALLRQNLLTAPEPVPINAPTFDREDLEAPFLHRFGISVLACVQGLQHYLSPTGHLTAFLKLVSRWFLSLLSVVVGIGLLGLIAAQFFESVMELFKNAMHHFMWGCLYLIGGLAALALLVAICVSISGQSKRK